jgi:hypothetical protein
VTEQKNQWNIKIQQLRDGLSQLANKTKQLLLALWHDMPIYWRKLKQFAGSVYQKGRNRARIIWQKLKSAWQGRKYHVRTTPGRNDDSTAESR